MNAPADDAQPVHPAVARIDAMPFARFHVKLLATLGSAHLLDAYDATALAFVLPVLVGRWELTPTQIGLLLAAGYVGQLAGAIAAGALAGRCGRLPALRLALVLLSTFSLLCAFATGYGWLLLLRLGQGLGLGGETPVAATYLNELSPARMRGRMISFIQWMFAIGTIVAAVLAPLLVPRFGWQAMFVVGASPLLLAAMLRRLLPESPVWLAAKGRLGEAAIALRGMGADGDALAAAPPSSDAAAGGAPRDWAGLFAEGRARGTFGAWVIAFCASFVGYGIIGWMPTLYRIVYHLPVALALRYGLSNGVAALFGGFIGIALMDRLSRKTYITIGFTGCALALAALGLLGAAATPLDAAILSGGGYMLLGMPMAGIYVYAPEIYPVQVRALGTGVTSAWLRVASIIGPPIIGVMLTLWPVQRIFFLFAAVAATGALGTLLLAVEPRRRT